MIGRILLVFWLIGTINSNENASPPKLIVDFDDGGGGSFNNWLGIGQCYQAQSMAKNQDWLMDYYHQFEYTKRDSHRKIATRTSTGCLSNQRNSSIPITRTTRYLRYLNQANRSLQRWSSANTELIQAIAKILILVILKILVKYYVRGYLRTHIDSSMLYELIDLLSKACTIAIAKVAIKWAWRPALRTAMKTFLIAGIKTLVKPFTKRMKKTDKSMTIDECQEQKKLFDPIIKFLINTNIKTVIKTVALHLLWIVFDDDDKMNQTLIGVIFRVWVIIAVKMSAKRLCKIGKKKKDKTATKKEPGTGTAPVDGVLLFAVQKLVTKLVKIPLIKILF